MINKIKEKFSSKIMVLLVVTLLICTAISAVFLVAVAPVVQAAEVSTIYGLTVERSGATVILNWRQSPNRWAQIYQNGSRLGTLGARPEATRAVAFNAFNHDLDLTPGVHEFRVMYDVGSGGSNWDSPHFAVATLYIQANTISLPTPTNFRIRYDAHWGYGVQWEQDLSAEFSLYINGELHSLSTRSTNHAFNVLRDGFIRPCKNVLKIALGNRQTGFLSEFATITYFMDYPEVYTPTLPNDDNNGEYDCEYKYENGNGGNGGNGNNDGNGGNGGNGSNDGNGGNGGYGNGNGSSNGNGENQEPETAGFFARNWLWLVLGGVALLVVLIVMAVPNGKEKAVDAWEDFYDFFD